MSAGSPPARNLPGQALRDEHAGGTDQPTARSPCPVWGPRCAQMSLACHAAPGREASVIRKGLNPKLDKEQTQSRSHAELFWIVKHGIKMTGMPTFGPTHKDEEIWALVAFLQKLPEVSPENYHQMVHEAGLPESPGVHAHNGGHGPEPE